MTFRSPDRPTQLISLLGLRPHPEGGHFAEVYRSDMHVRHGDRERSAMTTIYYLLRAGDVSRWHVVASDEVWHYYEGDGLELLTFDPSSRTSGRVVLAPASPASPESAASAPVHVVPAGRWQAVRPLGAYGLAGCTVGPGFEFEDFRFVSDLPDHAAAFDGPLRDARDLL